MSVLRTNVSPRTALLLGACALFVSVVLGREAQRAPLPAPEEALRPAARDAPAPLELDKLERREFADSRADLFAPVAPRPAPRAARAPAASAPPAPPPLPFRYLGKFVDDGETAVFLARGDEPVRAEPGATLPGEYRVEALAADAVTLRHLPLGIVHRIPIPPRP